MAKGTAPEWGKPLRSQGFLPPFCATPPPEATWAGVISSRFLREGDQRACGSRTLPVALITGFGPTLQSADKKTMRISLRTSGGRGEYELAGDQPPFTIDTVLNKRILVRMAPGLVFESGNVPRRKDGKPRIRLEPGYNHLYQYFAAAYLLPTPKRELGATGLAQRVLAEQGFSITHINFFIVDSSTDSFTIAPTSIECRNESETAIQIDHAHRLAMVSSFWSRYAGRGSVDSHRSSFESRDVNAVKAAWKEILRLFSNDPTILEWDSTEPPSNTDNDELILSPEHTVIRSIEARVREISKYRLQAIRSADARRFSGEVKTTYDYRCAFTGLRLPRPGNGAVPGVDAAHILPWKSYDVNVVSNGLCLSKSCHWAFDNGILRLDFNRTRGSYQLSIPDSTRHLAPELGLDLSYFVSLCGSVPMSRFPPDASKRPDPDLLNRLNSDLYG